MKSRESRVDVRKDEDGKRHADPSEEIRASSERVGARESFGKPNQFKRLCFDYI